MAKPIDSTYGFNIGHDVGSASWSLNDFLHNLDDLETRHGCKRIRYNLPLYTNQSGATQTYTRMLQCIEAALADGWDVMCGLTAQGGTALTSVIYTGAMKDALVAMATDVAAYTIGAGGRLRFQVGNEEEDNLDAGYAKVDFRTDVKTVATAVRAVFDGEISYTTFHSELAAWITEITTNGWGDMDNFYLNIYRNAHFYFQSAESDSLSKMAAAFSGANQFGDRRWGITELQSLDDGLSQSGAANNNGDESRTLYHMAQRIQIMKDNFPNIPYYYFGYDVSDVKWDYKKSAGGYRSYRKLFAEQSKVFVHTNPAYRYKQNLIGNPTFYNDTNDYSTENSATISTSGLSTAGVDGLRCARVKSTTHGVSAVFTNKTVNPGGDQSFNMLITQSLVGVPMFFSWYYKLDADQGTFPGPTGTGEASVSCDVVPAGSVLPDNTFHFTPTSSWQRYYTIIRFSNSGYISLRLWGKKAFTGESGHVLYDHLMLVPLYNDLVAQPLDYFDINTPYTTTTADNNGGTQYVDTFMWMPTARQLRI